jgi:hypothetical protein
MSRVAAQYQLLTFDALLFDATQNWDCALVGAACSPVLLPHLQRLTGLHRPNRQADTCRSERCACRLSRRHINIRRTGL